MPNIVGIQFKGVGKVYYFDPNSITFNKGDGVIVETARGVEYGVVSIPNSQISQEKIVGTLKPVIRKATEKDLAQYNDNLSKREGAMAIAKEKIEKHGLDMKLVDAEYTFDGTKLIFSFTAENRVDFRELVKDLAGQFHTRIELRQIGIRDECKVVGGLGPCGRPCCCNSFSCDSRVTIKMAKNQGLSLNPTKISGLCGRLMCCLKYEDEYYAETLKLMPKVGAEITMPEGVAVVESVDMLRQTIKAKVTLKNGETEIKQYHASQLPQNAKVQEVEEADQADELDVVEE